MSIILREIETPLGMGLRLQKIDIDDEFINLDHNTLKNIPPGNLRIHLLDNGCLLRPRLPGQVRT